MCSSAAAPIANEFVKEFGVSPFQSRLPVAMFLFGMSIGPVILTPLAEVSDTDEFWPVRRLSPFALHHRILAGRKS
jgi:hypothetical protein